ncbi:hypothetical protein C2E23DRAFT_499528 [Lenzites betulinus]|nr:hypothetical protein C2E23DRAFT_499528 [Lenzites betulinus]
MRENCSSVASCALQPDQPRWLKLANSGESRLTATAPVSTAHCPLSTSHNAQCTMFSNRTQTPRRLCGCPVANCQIPARRARLALLGPSRLVCARIHRARISDIRWRTSVAYHTRAAALTWVLASIGVDGGSGVGPCGGAVGLPGDDSIRGTQRRGGRRTRRTRGGVGRGTISQNRIGAGQQYHTMSRHARQRRDYGPGNNGGTMAFVQGGQTLTHSRGA